MLICLRRDLKPENLLIEKDPSSNMIIQTKIADFGLSRVMEDSLLTEICGTPGVHIMLFDARIAADIV